MDAASHDDGKVEYTSPSWAQRWFLKRSRDNWKSKYMQQKTDTKRLQNQVNDVSKSREKWRDETKQLQQRVQELEAENAALREQMAALKKDGPDAGTGSVQR
jgi:chromosome segregation ATPase